MTGVRTVGCYVWSERCSARLQLVSAGAGLPAAVVVTPTGHLLSSGRAGERILQALSPRVALLREPTEFRVLCRREVMGVVCLRIFRLRWPAATSDERVREKGGRGLKGTLAFPFGSRVSRGYSN